MSASPTSRSLAYLRDKRGCLAQVVERWNQYARKRIDLFGFIDIVALEPSCPGVLGVQATSDDNVSHRLEKITQDPLVRVRAMMWLASGNRMEIHGWGKKGPRGTRKTWQIRVIDNWTGRFEIAEPGAA